MNESEREWCAKIVEETPLVTGGYDDNSVWMHTEDAAETLANAADRIRALTVTPTPTPENPMTDRITASLDKMQEILHQVPADIVPADIVPADIVPETPPTPPTQQERIDQFQAGMATLSQLHGIKLGMKTYCLLATGGRVEATIPGVANEIVLVLE